MNKETETYDEATQRLLSVFKKNLNYYMKQTGKTREDISKLLNIPYNTVGDWIKGSKFPRMARLEKLAILFGVNKSDLIEEKDFDNLDDKDEVWEIRAKLQQRPELKVLFDMSSKATREDIEKAIQMVEILTNKK